MKALAKILLGAGVAVIMSSCDSAYNYGNNGGYGNGGYGNSGRVYRSPDGSVYRENQVYRDRDGNYYRNGSVYRSGNYRNYPNSGNLPPGQAKKVYGGNARDYAPGQQKKKYKKYKDYRDSRDYRNNDRGDRDRD